MISMGWMVLVLGVVGLVLSIVTVGYRFCCASFHEKG